MKLYNYPTTYTGFDAQDWFAERFLNGPIKPTPTDYKCCLCGKPFMGYGNSPKPFTDDIRMRCCDKCNTLYVVPARILLQEYDKYEGNTVLRTRK